MTSCSIERENICAYIDNELNEEDRLSFEKHIKTCKDCRNELDEMRRIIGFCSDLPQQELPVDFKAELHEKLVAVASRPEKDHAVVKKKRTIVFSRTIASVAAGIVLIFLAGSFYRMGLFSSKHMAGNTSSTAMAAEAPAAASKEESLNEFGIAGDGAMDSMVAGNEEESARKSANGEASTDGSGSAETDRSSMTMYFASQMPETAESRQSSITLTVDDPAAQVEKVRAFALEYDGDLANQDENKEAGSSNAQSMMTANPGTTDAKAENKQKNSEKLELLIPVTQYEQFNSSLSSFYGKVNVQEGALVSEDVTEMLNSLVSQSIGIDNRIQELQKNSDENAEEINDLKGAKEIIDQRIEKMRLENDFIAVTVYLYKK